MSSYLTNFKVGEEVIVKMTSNATPRNGVVTDTTTLRGLVKVKWTYGEGKTAEGWFKKTFIQKKKK